jgi:hypothetical protein
VSNNSEGKSDDKQVELGLNNKKVLGTGAFLVIGLLVILGLLFAFKNTLSKNWIAPAERPADTPRQQLAFESGELFKETRQSQIRELESYGWADAQHRFARVPVSRAMEIYLHGKQSAGASSGVSSGVSQ